MLNNIKEIIKTLKLDPTIDSYLNGRYSIGEPETITKDMYCIFKTVSTNDITQVEQKSRVQMILINGNYQVLSDVDRLIKIKLMTSRKLSDFSYHSIKTSGGIEGVTPLKSKLYTRDFIFNYDLNDY